MPIHSNCNIYTAKEIRAMIEFLYLVHEAVLLRHQLYYSGLYSNSIVAKSVKRRFGGGSSHPCLPQAVRRPIIPGELDPLVGVIFL